MNKKSVIYNMYTDDKDERIAELEEENEKLLRGTSKAQGKMGVSEFGTTICQLQKEIDYLEHSVRESKSKYILVEEENDFIKEENDRLNSVLRSIGDVARDKAVVESMKKQVEVKNNELLEARGLIDELQKVGWSQLPQKVVEDCKKSKESVDQIRKEIEESRKKEEKSTIENKSVKAQLEAITKAYDGEKKANEQHKETIANHSKKVENEISKVHQEWGKKEARRSAMEQKQIEALEYQIAQLKIGSLGQASSEPPQAAPAPAPAPPPEPAKRVSTKQPAPPPAPVAPVAPVAPAAPPPKAGPSAEQGKQMNQQINTLKKQNLELLEKLKTATDKKDTTTLVDVKKMDEQEAFFKKKLSEKDNEILALQKKVKALEAAKSVVDENEKKTKEIEKSLAALKAENAQLLENYQTELVLRKKYYNMVEDMKGKIRVICRARPISKTEQDRGNVECVTYVDEYTISVQLPKGPKEFQFDRVFNPIEEQSLVFEDTSNLIQSAVDGFNVCIFAYGQTGSGKTFTLIGDPVNNPGIAPRAFKKIYEIAAKMGKKSEFSITCYMLELYNDKLLDLLSSNSVHSDKLDIKKDAKGMVYIPGAEVKHAKTEKEISTIFETGSKSRHVASTKMNSESSRSHLVFSILIEATNLQTKKSVKGKLSVIDLAGSERVGKTGATDTRLKEANSINMSLSALGDVIAALTSDEQFVPYRNNKLTMLMQDSLGGNAKTLMFVNISPVDYNAPESVNSLNYASRVKLVKNDATKNVDNEEITRLKKTIEKLKSGEKVDI